MKNPVRPISYPRRFLSYLPLLAGRRPTAGVVFHHVPKCAGSAVRDALHGHFLPHRKVWVTPGPTVLAVQELEPGLEASQYTARIHLLRQEMLHFSLSRGARFVHGHIPFSPAVHNRFRTTHRFATVLRDPVERFVSQYFWSLHSKAHDHIEAALDEAFIATTGLRWGSTFVQYFADLPADADLRSREAIEAAKHNLQKLDVIGFSDDMPSFASALGTVLGVPVNIRHINLSPASTLEHRQVTPELLALVREACAPDFEVFNFARSLGSTKVGAEADVPDVPTMATNV